MKLIMSCVAALALFGCADEVGTSGDTEINVVGTKASENPRMDSDLHLRIEDVRFSERLGTWAESLIPPGMDKACVNCEVLFIHNSNGKIDNTEIWSGEGNYLCSVKQSATTIFENTCNKFRF